MDSKKLKTNFSFAFLAQGISLLVSCITNLILPKIIGVNDFSYWQLFIFYSTYIPCLAFGINDGVYLRYGGEDRERLPFDSIKSQYFSGMIFQIFLASIIGIISCMEIEDKYRKIVVIFSLIYFVFYTGHNYLGYIFQSCNETNIYSKSIIINRVFYLCIQLLLFLLGMTHVLTLISFYISAYALALFYLLYQIKNDFNKSDYNFKLGISEGIKSIKTGISLMISNVCSMLVLGVGRQIVDIRWGILAFGKISFSLTLMNFVLTFISQISMVLFPALCQLKGTELTACYKKLVESLFICLPLIYVLYFPGQWVLKQWLPSYSESISYLSVVLPVCYFDCKMNLIGNTFFKVLRKQVLLLKINIATILLSLTLSLLGAFVFHNMMIVIAGMVISVIFRSVIADLILEKYIGYQSSLYIWRDVFLATIFVVSASFNNTIWPVVMLLSIIGIRVNTVKRFAMH